MRGLAMGTHSLVTIIKPKDKNKKSEKWLSCESHVPLVDVADNYWISCYEGVAASNHNNLHTKTNNY